jgi:hypothetical protein
VRVAGAADDAEADDATAGAARFAPPAFLPVFALAFACFNALFSSRFELQRLYNLSGGAPLSKNTQPP